MKSKERKPGKVKLSKMQVKGKKDKETKREISFFEFYYYFGLLKYYAP